MTAYVDGEETELLRANYMYMALPLSAGRTQHPSDLCNTGSKVCNDYYAVCSRGICSAAACEMLRRKRRVKDCAAGNEE